MGHDKKDLDYKWQVINECKPKFASICIDRENFGNKEVLARINEMIKDRAPYTTIIQADGIPMSGADDTYKTTLLWQRLFKMQTCLFILWFQAELILKQQNCADNVILIITELQLALGRARLLKAN